MKVYLDKDELYPDYEITTYERPYAVTVEVSKELFDRYHQALASYQAVQRELRALDPEEDE